MKRLVRALTAAVAVASFFAAATAPVSAAERWTRAEAAEQYLSAVCPVTLAAGRVATLVSDPTSTHEDLTAAARQARNATWRSLVGTFHAHQLRRQRYRHRYGNTRATKGLGQFGRVKIDPVAGTARTAAFADRACAGRFNHD